MRHPRPPPLPTVIPLPCPHRGCPLKYGGTVAHGNFYPKNGKTQGGALFKNGKTQEGVPFWKGGLPGNFEEREKLRRGYPFRKGVYGENFEGRENAGGGSIKRNGKTQGGGTLLEGGLPERFGEKKNLYYICDE